MSVNNKLDQILTELSSINARLNIFVEVQEKHQKAIYGNGRDGLLTRISLVENTANDIHTLNKKIDNLSKTLYINIGKVASISLAISILVALVTRNI